MYCKQDHFQTNLILPESKAYLPLAHFKVLEVCAEWKKHYEKKRKKCYRDHYTDIV